jgi:hypothetical protein
VCGRSTLALEVMPAIASHETEIVGARAAQLAASDLVRLATRNGGWTVPYRDPSYGRLWEMSYPQSEMHGGGPPLLRVISAAEAANSYGYIQDV